MKGSNGPKLYLESNPLHYPVPCCLFPVYCYSLLFLSLLFLALFLGLILFPVASSLFPALPCSCLLWFLASLAVLLPCLPLASPLLPACLLLRFSTVPCSMFRISLRQITLFEATYFKIRQITFWRISMRRCDVSQVHSVFIMSSTGIAFKD